MTLASNNRKSTQRLRAPIRPALSLIELLVAIAIIATLLAILAPALSGASRRARATACQARLREIGTGLTMYADAHDGRLMPLAYTAPEIIGSGPPVYWWGTNEAGQVNHERGFLWPYLQSPLSATSVYECPQQPFGSYKPQGAAKRVTSTYGYNGYYLSPPHATSYSWSIGHLRWQTLSSVKDASRVFAFADAMLDLGGSQPWNTALLDPPWLYSSGTWSENESPTTSFRHDGRTQAALVDGHVEAFALQPGWLKSKPFRIGSVGHENGPHYVPEWKTWRDP